MSSPIINLFLDPSKGIEIAKQQHATNTPDCGLCKERIANLKVIDFAIFIKRGYLNSGTASKNHQAILKAQLDEALDHRMMLTMIDAITIVHSAATSKADSKTTVK